MATEESLLFQIYSGISAAESGSGMQLTLSVAESPSVMISLGELTTTEVISGFLVGSTVAVGVGAALSVGPGLSLGSELNQPLLMPRKMSTAAIIATTVTDMAITNCDTVLLSLFSISFLGGSGFFTCG